MTIYFQRSASIQPRTSLGKSDVSWQNDGAHAIFFAWDLADLKRLQQLAGALVGLTVDPDPNPFLRLRRREQFEGRPALAAFASPFATAETFATLAALRTLPRRIAHGVKESSREIRLNPFPLEPQAQPYSECRGDDKNSSSIRTRSAKQSHKYTG